MAAVASGPRSIVGHLGPALRVTWLALAAAVAGCGGAGRGQDEPRQTELERRQYAACKAAAERTTECAVADARATMTPKQLEALELDDTARRNTDKFMEACLAHPMSSRQVRVFEVCYREERQCEPFFACLDYAKPSAAPPAPR